uniref:Uncharacterized protein n=1 Tax=Setaria italica TaxID=4555 RepID=K3Y080_SETIT
MFQTLTVLASSCAISQGEDEEDSSSGLGSAGVSSGSRSVRPLLPLVLASSSSSQSSCRRNLLMVSESSVALACRAEAQPTSPSRSSNHSAILSIRANSSRASPESM